MTTRKFFKKVHLWLSIPVGLIITIICITGAILTFETEILELKYPDRYFVKESNKEKIPLPELIPIISDQLKEKDNAIASIKITSDPQRTYTVGLQKGMRSSAFVDPYTGKITGTYNFKDSSFSTVMSLHRWLLDGTRTWGKYTVGITTILFVFILISGIVWWAPTDRKKWKSRFTIKTTSGAKRFFYDLHLVLGIYACIFLLLCSLTGLMWSFEWYRNGVGTIFGAEKAEQRGGGHGRGGNSDDKKTDINPMTWATAFANIEKSDANYQYITINDGAATVLPKSASHSRATDRYKWNKKNGEVTEISKFGDKTTSSSIMSWAYALHVGAYGGIFTRILTCIACIIGASLPLTGYYIFYRKHLKKKPKRA
ncbi:PepSY-associated TM helix domain-containing protein [Dysgonomonas capnocytophagoides]|uniref:PepSY-associated TM helix domain-containing protein n=1 Tax=Dysgonomonas capnocytophagoides TaxID=45254 RepID=UPI00291C960C|nr:hypothetical protein DCPSUM001_34580 [Dysgonomonas capnocytophagoides]